MNSLNHRFSSRIVGSSRRGNGVRLNYQSEDLELQIRQLETEAVGQSHKYNSLLENYWNLKDWFIYADKHARQSDVFLEEKIRLDQDFQNMTAKYSHLENFFTKIFTQNRRGLSPPFQERRRRQRRRPRGRRRQQHPRGLMRFVRRRRRQRRR